MNNVVGVDDVTELWRVGAVDLPTVAGQYTEAATQIHKTALNEDGLFNTGEGMSPLHAPFSQIRDILQDQVFGRSHKRCVAAGEAVVKLADSYTTVDHFNARELERVNEFKDGVRNGPIEERPPAVVEPPSTTDPHPELNLHDYPGPPR